MNSSWMKYKALAIIAVLLCNFGISAWAKVISTDLLVVGGGASGVAASVQASRMGIHTVMIEESTWLGGMLTSAGVSAVDGNYQLRAGFWGEFLDSLVAHYGSLKALKTGWVSNVLFEPSVGNRIFKNICQKEQNLEIFYGYYPSSIEKNWNREWVLNALSDNDEPLTIIARCVIDATELGDVAKMAGIKYDKGMEAQSVTGEEIAPEEANGIIQDLTYVATLKDYGNDVEMEKPENYDINLYKSCCINDLCDTIKEAGRLWPKEKMMSYGALPNKKYMMNWPVEGNDIYLDLIEMSREQRKEALKAAKDLTLGFVYFIQHELGYKNLGLADDEYPTADRLPFIPYHRESRRIHGEVRFDFNYAKAPFSQTYPLYRTNIAVGDYPVDHHHSKYNGKEPLPKLHFQGISSFGLPMGTLIPKGVNDFIVAEKSISVSNIINGCTRLQPVVLQIGTAAGAIAALSILNNVEVKDVSVRDVQNAILKNGGYLQPYLDVAKNDSMFASLQRIGSTGILKGVGKKVGWANQYWLRADTVLLMQELNDLKEVYPYFSVRNIVSNQPVTVGEVMDAIKFVAKKENLMMEKTAVKAMKTVWQRFFGNLHKSDKIKRGQYAVLVDYILDPFNKKAVDLKGNFIIK